MAVETHGEIRRTKWRIKSNKQIHPDSVQPRYVFCTFIMSLLPEKVHVVYLYVALRSTGMILKVQFIYSFSKRFFRGTVGVRREYGTPWMGRLSIAERSRQGWFSIASPHTGTFLFLEMGGKQRTQKNPTRTWREHAQTRTAQDLTQGHGAVRRQGYQLFHCTIMYL